MNGEYQPDYFKLDAAPWDAGTDEVRRNYASLSGLPFPAECDDHDVPDDAPASASVAAWGAFLCALWFGIVASEGIALIARIASNIFDMIAPVLRTVAGVVLALLILATIGAALSGDRSFSPLFAMMGGLAWLLQRTWKGGE